MNKRRRAAANEISTSINFPRPDYTYNRPSVTCTHHQEKLTPAYDCSASAHDNVIHRIGYACINLSPRMSWPYQNAFEHHEHTGTVRRLFSCAKYDRDQDTRGRRSTNSNIFQAPGPIQGSRYTLGRHTTCTSSLLFFHLYGVDEPS